MTVEELFETEKLDQDFIERYFKDSYWESCNEFVRDNWLRQIDSLSPKQVAWLTKILEDCVERRFERESRR